MTREKRGRRKNKRAPSPVSCAPHWISFAGPARRRPLSQLKPTYAKRERVGVNRSSDFRRPKRLPAFSFVRRSLIKLVGKNENNALISIFGRATTITDTPVDLIETIRRTNWADTRFVVKFMRRPWSLCFCYWVNWLLFGRKVRTSCLKIGLNN